MGPLIAEFHCSVTRDLLRHRPTGDGASPGLRTTLIGASLRPWSYFFFPDGKCLGERTGTGRTLFHSQEGAAAVGIDDWNVEPWAIFEELLVALHVSLACRKPYEEESLPSP